MLEKIGLWLWYKMGGTGLEVLYTFLVFVVVIFLAMKLIEYWKYTLPPGPWGIPICGYLPFIKGDLYMEFGKLAKKYGSTFSVRFGSDLIVVLSDYKTIRQAFQLDEFSGRPHNDFMNILDGYGVINTEGALWKDQRKFIHTMFGTLSKKDGIKFLDNMITNEVQLLLSELEKRHGDPIDLSIYLSVSISNVICEFTMNERFRYDDERFKRFMNLINEGFTLFGRLTYANYIPILRYLPGIHSVRNKIAQNRTVMANFFQEIIDKHKRTNSYEVEDSISDVVDAYLYQIKEAEKKNEDHQLFQGKDKNRQIQQVMGDLFSAGMETVKNTLQWAVVFMLHYPEAAKAVQDELDQVVGRARIPLWEDMSKLPITNATIQEILRKSNLVPLGTTHATTRDVTLNGYNLPAGTHVIPLLSAVHMDPIWNDPEDFRPSRFLNEGTVTKPKYFMPFGYGKRRCLGEKLAHMEIFLFFSSLMHRFNLNLPEGESLPDLQGNVGITISPAPFKVCLLKRELIGCDINENIFNHGSLRKFGS
ncbi:PREDICTED: cytochrome P450 18a1 [Wasmannia auropunctata]|uniref:cytochrome P450 18a1 n=1 Tax=Wasmannia auropunctata TaxID=64793 RepID=UPI0005EDD943|nr:PREDICTED: cytochrome P450 18a1 [Wasmannia auropunctata]